MIFSWVSPFKKEKSCLCWRDYPPSVANFWPSFLLEGVSFPSVAKFRPLFFEFE